MRWEEKWTKVAYENNHFSTREPRGLRLTSRLRECGTIIHSSFSFFSNLSPSFQTFFHSRPPCVSSYSSPFKSTASNGHRSACDFTNRLTLPSIWTPHQFSSGILFHPRSSLLKNMYRKINAHLAELLWLEVIWLFDWWAHIKVDLYIDSETLELMGKEHALLVCNHKSDIDWLIGWVLAQRSGCLGSALALIKKSLKFLPVIGWSMWFTEYIFLERSWSKDKNTLKAGFENLRDFPMPFWLAVFVEGTRFTQAKLLAAQEYAVATKLPVPKNVLIPRTKGFVAAVNHLRSFVPAIYNCTVAIPKDEPLPTVLRMFGGRSSRVHVQIKRHLICDLPETDDGIRQWCRDIFVEKDASLELHHFKNSFEDMECHGIGRPKKSLFVVIIWSCILIYGGVEFFKWCSFSWATIAFCAMVLLVVVISMQVLILFSQSEKSNPPQESTTINNSRDILKHKLLP